MCCVGEAPGPEGEAERKGEETISRQMEVREAQRGKLLMNGDGVAAAICL